MADSSRPLVDVSPETLLFQLSPNKQVGCLLYVINSSGVTTAFKVKTTEPRRYLVRPNQGLVAPGKTKQISVYLIEKESNELLRAPALLNSIVDKFLVQTAAVADKDATAISSPTSNPQPEELLKIWQKVAKASIRNKKLAVKMLVSPDATEHLAAGTPGTASVLSPSRSLAINASTPLSSPGLPEPSPANRGRYSTGSIIRDTRGAPSSGGSFSKGGGGLEVDARVLANKYEDLVNYTANLTEERDELNQALEEAKKALQREMAARIALESKGQMQQGRKQSSIKGTGGIRAGSQYQQRSTGGFSLTTLMVVALVFFLLGHWLDLSSSGHGSSSTTRPRSPVEAIPVEAATVEAAGIGSSTPLET